MKQDPQDGELRRQILDRRVTALSDKQNQTLCKGLNELQNGQKLALSLIKPPPSQGISKGPVSMVTARINGQKVASSDALQTTAINLQTGGRAAPGGGGHAFSSRRAGESPPSQMLGTLSAVPIKVPQVSSLHRLAGQAATVLPQVTAQVRPKTQIPDSLPQSPCEELQPLGLQRATAVVSPRGQGPTLPTANSTFSPEQPPKGTSAASPPALPPHGQAGGAGGPVQLASAGPGVAFAIIAASPAASNGVSAISEAIKVIIIQPPAPCSMEGAGAEATPTPKSPKPQKEDEDPEKVAFMVALGLVTTDHLEEIQTKRQERKRRSTANPAYSGLFEPERKRLASHYLNSSLFLSARDSEDLCWKEDVQHDAHCAVCQEDGELQPCHNCPRAFHPDCLQPALKTPPRGAWYCPKCQKKVLNKENMSWPQNFVQSYVTHKTVRQEEKRRLLRRNVELKKECSHLEEQDEKLSDTLKHCMDLRERLLGQQRDTQASLERLRSLVRLIQRDQLIQVTMTTTASIAAASLLSQSWIKPSSAAAAAPGPSATPPPQKSHAHSRDDGD
ncbi:PHD finger protein 21B isoform X3 [Pseudoliparis swirei]|uniref:PHD finger protein 21B isoform X3 n=1 Tax=Pseudoliparis swirei TaxID=2059687 RepID=UPI0024BE2A26|nr:PHD finger protein 21B isoform X3 [Pseudoliparis swirei]